MLESLLTMVLLAIMSTVVLVEISKSRGALARQNEKIAVLNLALMAFDSGQSSLSQNGVTVKLEKRDKKLVVTHKAQEVVSLELLQEIP
ncbi:competence system putative prepilin ComGE [Pseudolactococcus piscium]|nr:competence system putative prepilin ComGE [Lactococcus piscium]